MAFSSKKNKNQQNLRPNVLDAFGVPVVGV